MIITICQPKKEKDEEKQSQEKEEDKKEGQLLPELGGWELKRCGWKE